MTLLCVTCQKEKAVLIIHAGDGQDFLCATCASLRSYSPEGKQRPIPESDYRLA